MHLKSSENKIGMYFSLLILVSNWQLSTHLSPHFLFVCLVQTRKITDCCKTQKWNSAELHRDRDLSSSSQTSQSQAVKAGPGRDPAPAEPFTQGKCSWVQEEQDTRDVRVESKAQGWLCCAPEHLTPFSHTCAKMLMLQFIWLEEPHEHPIFPASVKTDLWAKPGLFFYGGKQKQTSPRGPEHLRETNNDIHQLRKHLPFTNTRTLPVLWFM